MYQKYCMKRLWKQTATKKTQEFALAIDIVLVNDGGEYN